MARELVTEPAAVGANRTPRPIDVGRLLIATMFFSLAIDFLTSPSEPYPYILFLRITALVFILTAARKYAISYPLAVSFLPFLSLLYVFTVRSDFPFACVAAILAPLSAIIGLKHYTRANLISLLIGTAGFIILIGISLLNGQHFDFTVPLCISLATLLFTWTSCRIPALYRHFFLLGLTLPLGTFFNFSTSTFGAYLPLFAIYLLSACAILRLKSWDQDLILWLAGLLVSNSYLSFTGGLQVLLHGDFLLVLAIPCLIAPRVIKKHGRRLVAASAIVAVCIVVGIGLCIHSANQASQRVQLWLKNHDVHSPEYLQLDQVSPHLVRSALAFEDSKFYEHRGLDWPAIHTAVRKDLSRRTLRFGGSTITQQLARTLFEHTDKTAFGKLGRKWNEIFLAQALEHRLSKQEILVLYLNTNEWYGCGMVGIRDASRFYLGKEPADLTIADSIFLTSLPSRVPVKPSEIPLAAGNREQVAIRLSQVFPSSYDHDELLASARCRLTTLVRGPLAKFVPSSSD